MNEYAIHSVCVYTVLIVEGIFALCQNPSAE